jgi:hypothetical protein
MPHLEQRAFERALEYLWFASLFEHVELDSADGRGDYRIEIDSSWNGE